MNETIGYCAELPIVWWEIWAGVTLALVTAVVMARLVWR